MSSSPAPPADTIRVNISKRVNHMPVLLILGRELDADVCKWHFEPLSMFKTFSCRWFLVPLTIPRGLHESPVCRGLVLECSACVSLRRGSAAEDTSGSNSPVILGLQA